MKRFFRSLSLKYYVMLSLIFIILLQTTVFAGFLVANTIPEDMDGHTFETLRYTVDSNAFSLEKYIGGFVNMTGFYDTISSTASANASAQNLSVRAYFENGENRQKFLDNITPDILRALRLADASCCFVILEGGSARNAVYLADQNPNYDSYDNSDVHAVIGSSSLLYDHGLTLDAHWSQTLEKDALCPFYQPTLESAAAYPGLSASGLGYFSVSNFICEEYSSCLFYTVPLMDADHNAYGVAGFGVSFDSIKKLLPDRSLALDPYGSYLLGIMEDASAVSSVYIGNDDYYAALKSGESVPLVLKNAKYGIYSINSALLPSDASICMTPLKFYADSSPYQDQQWVLCGLVNTDTLYASSDQIRYIFYAAVLVSLLLSVLGAILITHFFMRPINMLNRSIPKLSPGNNTLPQTKISEFDAIAKAIEKQNDSIYKSGNKMSEIIDIAGISLGVCEFDKANEMIYCTHKLFEILEISDFGWEHNRIAKVTLIVKLKGIEPFLEQSHENPTVFCYRRPGCDDKWLDIKQKTTEKTTLLVISDITESVLEKEKILHDRDYDTLTGLYNRGAFAREMKYMIDEGHCTNGLLSIWDLDNLKYTNDTYGHSVGDKYICALSELLKRRMPEKSFSARLAGDEFTMFLYDEPKETLIAALENIHSELMQVSLTLPDGLELNMSASAGMSFYSEDGINYSDLLKYADFAMYQVKKSSKGSMKAYNKETYLRDYILVQGVGELDRLIRHESIKYVYQPIISLKTGAIFAYEALMRPISDLLRKPEELLRVAEAQAKLNKIERITWFHALRNFFEQLKPDDNARIFINSIPNQLLSDEEWTQIETLYGSKLSRIVMEITENAKSDFGIDKRKREFCSKWNIPIALDDYGSGYSNSDMLVSYNFHFVKLDMLLIRDIHKHSSTQSLVRGMISYCHENYIMVIAEGIETVDEYNTAKELGADFGQGFYLAKPAVDLYPA